MMKRETRKSGAHQQDGEGCSPDGILNLGPPRVLDLDVLVCPDLEAPVARQRLQHHE
jgi:hypothetical protein